MKTEYLKIFENEEIRAKEGEMDPSKIVKVYGDVDLGGKEDYPVVTVNAIARGSQYVGDVFYITDNEEIDKIINIANNYKQNTYDGSSNNVVSYYYIPKLAINFNTEELGLVSSYYYDIRFFTYEIPELGVVYVMVSNDIKNGLYIMKSPDLMIESGVAHNTAMTWRNVAKSFGIHPVEEEYQMNKYIASVILAICSMGEFFEEPNIPIIDVAQYYIINGMDVYNNGEHISSSNFNFDYLENNVTDNCSINLSGFDVRTGEISSSILQIKLV